MMRQFTATAYVIHEGAALLLFHKKLQKWLPPGGHIEPNETPPEAVIREVKEETGLDIELISEDHITVDRWNAKSIPRPFLCLLEEIPAHKQEPAHQHVDLIFLAKPIGGILIEEAGTKVSWLRWPEIAALKGDEEIFEETRDVLQRLLNTDITAGVA